MDGRLSPCFEAFAYANVLVRWWMVDSLVMVVMVLMKTLHMEEPLGPIDDGLEKPKKKPILLLVKPFDDALEILMMWPYDVALVPFDGAHVGLRIWWTPLRRWNWCFWCLDGAPIAHITHEEVHGHIAWKDFFVNVDVWMLQNNLWHKKPLQALDVTINVSTTTQHINGMAC